MEPTPLSVLDSGGRPVWGCFAGPLGRVDLRGRAGWRPGDLLRHKRWVYALVASPERLCAAAIVDAGYGANAFALVADAQQGLLGQVSALTWPVLARVGDRPEQGCDAAFVGPRLRLSLRRPQGASAYRLQVESRDLSIDAILDTLPAPPPLVAICDLSRLGGGVNVTQKRALLRAAGVIRVGSRTLPLDDASGGLDYTQGVLPRHTAWRWAFLTGRAADGTPVGLNLVQGWNGEQECAAWVAGDLWPLGEGRIHRDPRSPQLPWHVTSACGAVDLSLHPLARHAERRDLLLVRSRFEQFLGSYHGTLRLAGRAPLALSSVLGVVEDQDVRW